LNRTLKTPIDCNAQSKLFDPFNQTIGMFIYLITTVRSTPAFLTLLQWVPMAFFPLLVAQVFSTSEKVYTGSLFLLFRLEKGQKHISEYSSFNLTYPYFLLCVLSASAANMREPWFYAGLVTLSAWSLWSVRSKRCSPALWVGLLICVGGAGYLGHTGPHALQGTIEKTVLDRIANFMRDDADPYRSQTAIGEVGSLKMSNRILFRVKRDAGLFTPCLLREASYDTYRASVWFAIRPKFAAVQPEIDGATWKLNAGSDGTEFLTVSLRLKGRKGMLKLPNGTVEIANLPVFAMLRNRFGDVQVKEGPGLIDYRVKYRFAPLAASSPTRFDTRLPWSERPVIEDICASLHLKSKPAHEIVKALTDFFENHFFYSLELKRNKGPGTSLGNFLLNTRAGHCEYFATATVLLLRAAGIPARYATGYSVHEFDDLEKCFVVRSSHAHAWALALVDGRWVDVDTTPGTWIDMEKNRESFLQPLYDLWSYGTFKFLKWRWSEREGSPAKTLGWLLIPLAGFLIWRIYSRSRVRRIDAKNRRYAAKAVRLGMDSEFYRIEQALAEMGQVRNSWETLSQWLQRVEDSPEVPISVESLRPMLKLHYRYRFDPRGITAEEREDFRSSVKEWLEAHAGG